MVFRYIRQMSNTQKEKIRARLAMVYAAIAWNGFAICLYSFVKKDKRDSGLPPGLHEAVMSNNIETAKVIHIDGLSLVEEREYTKEEIEEARRSLQIKSKSEDNSDDF